MTDETKNEQTEPDLIETIFYELDDSMFLVALVGGAILGGFLLYLFMQRRSAANVLIAATTQPEPEIEIDVEDDEEDQPVELEDAPEQEYLSPAGWSPSAQVTRNPRG